MKTGGFFSSDLYTSTRSKQIQGGHSTFLSGSLIYFFKKKDNLYNNIGTMPLYFAKTQKKRAFWLSVQKSEIHYKIEKKWNIHALLPFCQNIQLLMSCFWILQRKCDVFLLFFLKCRLKTTYEKFKKKAEIK